MSSVAWISAPCQQLKRIYCKVKRLVVVRNKIPSNNVIDEAVTIVIDSVRRFIAALSIGSSFPRISPHIWQQILVSVVNTCVNDGNDESFASRFFPSVL